jgi:signal transduction histidine kinase
MKIIKTKSGAIILTIAAINIFFLALIWVSYVRQRTFDRKDAIHFAIERNSNLSVALEQYAIRTLRNADAVLQIIKIEFAFQGDSLDLKQLVKSNSINREFIEGVAIIDKNSRLVKTNIEQNKQPPYFSDRSFFIFHLLNNTDTLLISRPMLSKLIGKPVIVISRRLNDAKGHFAGVVMLQVEPSTFTSFYAQAHLLPHGIISLIAPDGITYARRTGNIESSGEDIRESPLFDCVGQNTDSFYFAKDVLRGVPTWFSYRKLKEYPIIATVGSAESEILANYAKRQPRYIAPRVIISILVVLFSFLLSFILLHRRRLAEHLLKEEERYQRLLTEGMIEVQEREREWIGRELHDNVNQVLTTVKLYLETASKHVDNPLIPRSMQLINSSIKEIRNLSHQLSAPTLGTRSLIDSINVLIEMIGFSSNLQIDFDHDEYKGQLNMNQKLALYRILQELMKNVVGHAEATKVWITLGEKNRTVILKVKDNGKGFDPTIEGRGMGINNILSRARIIGGNVDIESAPGKGCLINVVIPIQTTKGDLPVLKRPLLLPRKRRPI